MSDRAFRLRLFEGTDESPPREFYEVRFEELPSSAADEAATAAARAGREELLKFEYERAQEMLQHYDNLTWHIGSILIAGILVLTGLGLGKDGFDAVAKGWRSLIIVYGVPGISSLVLSLWALWFRRMRAHYRFRDETLHRLEAELGMFHFLRIVEANEHKKFRLDDTLTEVTLPGVNLSSPSSPPGRTTFTVAVADLGNEAYKNTEAYRSLTPTQTKIVDERLTEKRRNLIGKLARARRAAWVRDAESFEPMVETEHAGPPSYKLVWGLATVVPLLQLCALMTLWTSNMWERAYFSESLNLRPWGETYAWHPYWIWFHAGLAAALLVFAAVKFWLWLKDEF